MLFTITPGKTNLKALPNNQNSLECTRFVKHLYQPFDITSSVQKFEM